MTQKRTNLVTNRPDFLAKINEIIGICIGNQGAKDKYRHTQSTMPEAFVKLTFDDNAYYLGLSKEWMKHLEEVIEGIKIEQEKMRLRIYRKKVRDEQK